MFFHQLFQRLDTVHLAGGPLQSKRTAVTIWAWCSNRREQQRREQMMEPGHVADADIAERIAVVGRSQGQEASLVWPRLCTLPPELERHLERHLHGRGAVIREENVCQTRRGQLGQPASEQDRRHIGLAQKGAMGNEIELGTDRFIDLRYAMAVDVAPERRHAVDVLVTVRVHEKAAVSPLDDKRLFRGIGLHRRERMPDVVAVPLFKLLATSRHGHCCTDSTETGSPTWASSRVAALP